MLTDNGAVSALWPSPTEPGGIDARQSAIWNQIIRCDYPDGEQVIVGTNRIGDNGLWIVVPASGRWTPVQMPHVPEERIIVACWAPNGRELGVKRILRNGTTALWRVAVDGSAAEPLVQPAPALPGDFACAFSPDGQQLLYSRIVEGFNQLFVFDLTARRDRALTHSGSHKYQGALPDAHGAAWVQ